MKSRALLGGLILALATAPTPAPAANEMRFGSWESSAYADGNSFGASTSNDSGNTLGLACYSNISTCYWVLFVGNSCEVGGTYVVLANSDAGANTLQLSCLDIGDTKMMVFNDFEAIERDIRRNPRIGIAFPMRDGAFTVMRFNLDGANQAIDRTKRLASEAAKNSTTNQRL